MKKKNIFPCFHCSRSINMGRKCLDRVRDNFHESKDVLDYDWEKEAVERDPGDEALQKRVDQSKKTLKLVLNRGTNCKGMDPDEVIL